MSPRNGPSETTRQWLTGLVVIVATVVAFIGFASASLWWTIAIASFVWAALIVFLYCAGVRKERAGREHRPGA
jgi:uncharacterized membrane protein